MESSTEKKRKISRLERLNVQITRFNGEEMTVSSSVRELACEYVRARQQTAASFTEASGTFKCSERSIHRWLARQAAFGHVEPTLRGKGFKGFVGIEEEHFDFLMDELTEFPSMYYVEMCGLLYDEFDVAYSRSQVRRALKHKGITRKVLERHARQQDPATRAAFRNIAAQFTAAQICAVDETHVAKRDAHRRTGFSLRGRRAFQRVASVNGQQQGCSSIAGITIEGVKAVRSFQLVGGAEFMDFLENDLLPVCNPYPQPCSVILLDNATVHLKAQITTLCQREGVLVLFLPPYSYDFQPIELLFHMAKSYLRRKWPHESTTVVLQARMEEALWNCCSPRQACNLFSHCFIVPTAAEYNWATR